MQTPTPQIQDLANRVLARLMFTATPVPFEELMAGTPPETLCVALWALEQEGQIYQTPEGFQVS